MSVQANLRGTLGSRGKMPLKSFKQILTVLLRTLKHFISLNPEIPLVGIYSEKILADVHRYLALRMFIHHCLQQGKFWKQPSCSVVGKWLNQFGYIQVGGYIFCSY